MIAHTLKTLARILLRYPGYTVLNILGLAAGMSCCLLIFLWIQDELTFEDFHPGADRIYRVLVLQAEGNGVIRTPVTPMPLADALEENYPQIALSTFIKFEPAMPLDAGGKILEGIPAYVEKDFFSVFDGFTFTEGSPESGFAEAGSVILSEEMSARLFGDGPALGRTLVSEKYEREIYTVGGVVRIPRKSHIYFDIALPVSNNRFLKPRMGDWRFRESTSTYIRLQPHASFDSETLDEISGILGQHLSVSDRIVFQPLKDIHLHSDYDYSWDRQKGNVRTVLVYSALAILILVIAALNYVILSTVRSLKRSGEVGIRKVLGSSKRQLAMQYTAESIIECMLAVMLGMVLVRLLMPWFNDLVHKDIRPLADLRTVAMITGFGGIVGLLSGYYPALYLSSLNPVNAFRGGSTTGSRSGVLNILITLQYIVSIGMIICTIYIYRQITYVEHMDLGFNRDNILVIPTGLWYGMENFKQEILKDPDIISATACMNSPADFYWENRNISWEGETGGEPVTMTEAFVDEDFARTYGLQMVRGSFLSFRFEDYWKAGVDSSATSAFTMPAVINETAWKIMGFEDPIGHTVNGRYLIVGVVKDFHFKSLHEKIAPLLMTYNPEAIFSLNVRIRNTDRDRTIGFIEKTYSKFRPTRGFSCSFLADDLRRGYASEENQARLFLYFTLLSIIISILGLLGLTGYTLRHRIRELTLRRIWGAGPLQIRILFVRDYARWVLLAFVAAWPVSRYVMVKWSQAFAYRADLSWWIFVLAGGISLVMAILAIFVVIRGYANKNPVEFIRYE